MQEPLREWWWEYVKRGRSLGDVCGVRYCLSIESQFQVLRYFSLLIVVTSTVLVRACILVDVCIS
jgi:hypothetical protein